MARKKFQKDIEEVLDYALDLKPLTHGVTGAESDYLVTGETISSHTVSADYGLTISSSSESDGIITIWTSGGTFGRKYLVTVKFITSAGRTGRRTFEIEMIRK